MLVRFRALAAARGACREIRGKGQWEDSYVDARLIIAPDGPIANRDFTVLIYWISGTMLRSLETGIGLAYAQACTRRRREDVIQRSQGLVGLAMAHREEKGAQHRGGCLGGTGSLRRKRKGGMERGLAGGIR